MLAPADAALAARDPTLPGLAVVLDPEAVLARSALGTEGSRPLCAEATYVRYKAGTSCVVGYRLLTDAATVLAYAKAYNPADAAKLDKAREKEAPDPAMGWGVVADDAHSVLIATASSDRDLPALAALADAGRRRTLLRRLLPDHPDLWDVAPRPMRHKPERRWLGVVERDGDPVALLKAYRPNDVGAARAGQKLLAVAAVTPLGWSPRHAVLASTWTPGEPMIDALAGAVPVDAAAVGAVLARIHALRTSAALPRTDGQREAGAVAEAGEAVAAVAPELRDRACRLAGRVGRALRARHGITTVVHGDFSADQVVLTSGGAIIIDFDSAAVADPAVDVGSFAADLDRAEIEGRLQPGQASGVVSELTAGHHHAGGPPVGDRLVAHRAAALLRLAVAPFRDRIRDWPTVTEALLRRAEAVAEGL